MITETSALQNAVRARRRLRNFVVALVMVTACVAAYQLSAVNLERERIFRAVATTEHRRQRIIEAIASKRIFKLTRGELLHEFGLPDVGSGDDIDADGNVRDGLIWNYETSVQESAPWNNSGLSIEGWCNVAFENGKVAHVWWSGFPERFDSKKPPKIVEDEVDTATCGADGTPMDAKF